MFIVLPGVTRQKVRGEGKEWRKALQRGEFKALLAWARVREAALHPSRPQLDAGGNKGQADTALVCSLPKKDEIPRKTYL